jgi:hypothetical protein
MGVVVVSPLPTCKRYKQCERHSLVLRRGNNEEMEARRGKREEGTREIR